MPWVKIEKPYVLEGPEGACRLGDLFRGRSQLAIYHFMLTRARTMCDPAARSSRSCGCGAPAFRACQAVVRRGLARAASANRGGQEPDGLDILLRFVAGQRLQLDFGVSFTPEDIAAGRAIYNYGTVIRKSQDMFGASVFVKDDDGAIFHSYSTYHRGAELLMGAFNWLDLVPEGRNESGGVMNWVRRHDEY